MEDRLTEVPLQKSDFCRGYRINFVGVGAPRCATTWIYECLKEHPQLEILPKDQAPRRGEPYFKKEDTLKGDFQVFYLSSGEETLKKIKHNNPDIKIIVSLRNPAERAYSHYKHTRFTKNKKWQSMEEAARETPEIIIEPGFYYKHLKKYFDIFPRENILILFCGDIKQNPREATREIYNFLGVDDSFNPQVAGVTINPSDFKETQLGRLMHKVITPALGANFLGRKIKASGFLKRLYYGTIGLYSGRGEPSGELEYLKKIYRGDIEKLEGLLNRDLTHWK